SGATPTFSSSATLAYQNTSSLYAAAKLITPDSQLGAPRSLDFNGDGRADLALVLAGHSGQSAYFDAYELVSNGTTFSATFMVGNLQTAAPFFVNWNDDACTDYIWAATLYLSACNGSAAPPITLPVTPLTVMDWDGDGRTDLIVANGSTIGTYLSTGT